MTRLKWKAYDYTAQLTSGGAITFRPLMELLVSSHTRKHPGSILALIDSGTDSMVFSAAIARSLGIDPRTCQKVRLGGIGTSEGFISDIKITVADFNASIDLPVIFIDNPPFDALLGQRHFFERFKVRFEKDINKFYLAPVAEV